MQHDGLMLLVILSDILGIQPVFRGQLIVRLYGTALPFSAKRIDKRKLQLRPVKCSFSGGNLVFKTGGFTRFRKRILCPIPGCIIADPFFRPCRKFNEYGFIVKAEIPIERLEQVTELAHFGGNLFFRTENMRIVLHKTAHPHNTVQRTGRFIPRTGAELRNTQRQIAVALYSLFKDFNMPGTVHRFKRKHPFFAFGDKHIFLVFFPVPRPKPETLRHNKGGIHLNIAVLFNLLAYMLLYG